MTANVDTDHAVCIVSRRSVSGGAVLLLLFVDRKGYDFGDVRVKLRCFGGNSGISVVFASGATIYDAGDGGILGADDGKQPGGYPASQQPL